MHLLFKENIKSEKIDVMQRDNNFRKQLLDWESKMICDGVKVTHH